MSNRWRVFSGREVVGEFATKREASREAERIGGTVHKKYRQWTDEQYRQKLEELKIFSPTLRKISHGGRRKRFEPWQKGYIRKLSRKLMFHEQLVPIDMSTKKKRREAEKMKELWYAPGIPAIRLDNTGVTGKIIPAGNQFFVVSNGRKWIYWRIDKPIRRTIKKKIIHQAKTAFTPDEFHSTFAIEKIADLAEEAFRLKKAIGVALWRKQGRSERIFESLRQFMRWMAEQWGGYTEPEKWINGIAILVREKIGGKRWSGYEDDEDGDE